MKDNRYYVPDLTEFRVGFRYEVFSQDKFVKLTFNELSSLDFTNDLLKLKCYRVKSLCEEDILELGFVKQESKYKPYNIWFEKQVGEDVVCLSVNEGKLRIMISSKTLFEGQVKNYNELEVILKQIGI